jgi:hypothetical protein
MSSLTQEVVIQLPIENRVTFDRVISHAILNSQTVYLLSQSAHLYELHANHTITVVQRFPLKPRRLFSIDSDHLFLSAIGGEGSFSPGKTKQMKFPPSTVGFSSLHVGSAAAGLAPHGLSHIGNSLVIIREGIAAMSSSTQELQEPIVGLHGFVWGSKSYVAVSHPTSTRFVEIADSEIRQVDPPAMMKEQSQTLGVAVLRSAKDLYMFQIFSDCFTISSTTSKDYPCPATISHCASTSRQLLLAFSNRMFRLLAATDSNTINPSELFERQAVGTALCLSIPDPTTGLAELFAFGASESAPQPFSLRVQVLAADQAARILLLTEKMPCKVTGIEFIDDTRLCVGLENGCIVVGTIERSLHRLESVLICHYGQGCCSLTRFYPGDSAAVLALSSRPAIITLSPHGRIPRIRPVAVNSFAYGAFIQHSSKSLCFLSAAGRILTLNFFAEAGDDFAVQALPINNPPIVAIRVLEKTQFVFIAVASGIGIYDEFNPPAFQLLEQYENERVISIDINNGQLTCCLAVATRTEDSRFLLRLHDLNVSATGLQISAPVFGQTDQRHPGCCARRTRQHCRGRQRQVNVLSSGLRIVAAVCSNWRNQDQYRPHCLHNRPDFDRPRCGLRR